jgi:two-component system, chemotaxis family, response regulator PixG
VSEDSERIQSNLKELILKFQQLKTLVFSGRLIIRANDRTSWTFLIRIGCLSWQTGGQNLDLRWQQHLNEANPNLPDEFLKPVDFLPSLEREGYLLSQLLGRGLLDKQQIIDLMMNTAIEIVFDLIQWCKLNGDSISYELIPSNVGEKITLPLPLLEIEQILRRSIQTWQAWQNAGLTNCSPNRFPIIEQQERLQKLLSPEHYQNLISSLDGTQTLRNLAAKKNKNVLNYTQSLIPLVKTGAIVLSPRPKISPSAIEIVEKKQDSSDRPDRQQPIKKPPLIVCIDDSPSVHQTMEKILSQQGYRFLSLEDPLKALLILLKTKPDLVFLDLLMPVVNGYEVCAQIRKAPSLKDVPVVILTGRDGLVDRMRAKLVGSTDFLPKPVEPDGVLKMLDKYLANVVSSRDIS